MVGFVLVFEQMVTSCLITVNKMVALPLAFFLHATTKVVILFFLKEHMSLESRLMSLVHLLTVAGLLTLAIVS